MPSNFTHDKINQPVTAASEEQSDFDVARGVYAQLRQGVEPDSLLEQVDDAICATSGKGRSRTTIQLTLMTLISSESGCAGPILHLCKSKLQLYQTVELWKRNTLNEIEALGTLHTTQLSKDLRTKFLSAAATSRRGAEKHGSLLCGIFYARLSQAIMSPVLPLTMHMPRQLEELSDPSVELVDQVLQSIPGLQFCQRPSLQPHVHVWQSKESVVHMQKKHLCDFEQLPSHKSTDHLKMLLRHEIEKAWDASKHQRSEGNLVRFFNSRDVAQKLQEAGLLDRGRQQALSSLMQAFYVEVCHNKCHISCPLGSRLVLLCTPLSCVVSLACLAC